MRSRNRRRSRRRSMERRRRNSRRRGREGSRLEGSRRSTCMLITLEAPTYVAPNLEIRLERGPV